MSSSSIHMAGRTLWFNDEAFVFWLRMMALNLENCRNADYAWSSEIAEDWMCTTRLGVGNNAMGVQFDDDFVSPQQTLALQNTAKRVSEIVGRLDDVTMELVASSLGVEQPYSIVDVQSIVRSFDSLLAERVEQLRATSFNQHE